MDELSEHWTRKRQKEYRERYKGNFSGTGMFVMRKRKQLLGIEPKTVATSETAKKTAIANFNYDVRENVKLGLVDLQLFIESSDKKEVDAVITMQIMEEVLRDLLSRVQASKEKLKIAQLLVNLGLEYIQEHAPVTEIQERLFKDTIETSKQLAYLMLPKEDRDCIGWYPQKW